MTGQTLEETRIFDDLRISICPKGVLLMRILLYEGSMYHHIRGRMGIYNYFCSIKNRFYESELLCVSGCSCALSSSVVSQTQCANTGYLSYVWVSKCTLPRVSTTSALTAEHIYHGFIERQFQARLCILPVSGRDWPIMQYTQEPSYTR